MCDTKYMDKHFKFTHEPVIHMFGVKKTTQSDDWRFLFPTSHPRVCYI